MVRIRPALAILAIITSCGLPGCGPKEDPVATANAQKALDAGFEAYQAGEWEKAAEQFTVAIDIGGIHPDHYSRALVERSICLARIGKFSEAHADLDIAEQGADLGVVYAARSFVFEKEGKKKEAQAAFAEARRYNRSVKKIKD